MKPKRLRLGNRNLNLFLQGLLICSICFASRLAKADVITFDGFNAGSAAPVTTYSEAGFTLTPAGDSWFQAIDGNPAPSIGLNAIPYWNLVGVSVSLVVTGPTQFTWQSLGYYSNGTAAYVITGFLGGRQQFQEAGPILPEQPPMPFMTLNGTDSNTPIDTLDIALIPLLPNDSFFSGVVPPSDISLDNIVLNPVSAPEPNSALPIGLVFLSAATVGARKARSGRAVS